MAYTNRRADTHRHSITVKAPKPLVFGYTNTLRAALLVVFLLTTFLIGAAVSSHGLLIVLALEYCL